MFHPRHLLALGCAGLFAATPAQAQFSSFLDKILPPALRASEAAGALPSGDAAKTLSLAAGQSTAVLAGEAPPVGPKKGVEAELKPDTACNRPQERFNIGEKLLDYAGEAAAARLTRLIASDFKFSDLTHEDHQMLRYLAQTTVWVPAEIETKIGSIFEGARSLTGGNTLSEADELEFEKVDARMKQLKAAAADFPGDIKLVYMKSGPNGAFAQFGGVIQVSDNFVKSSFSERPDGGAFVLAHELSHVYKRHAVKDLQYKLISSKEGWDLARKVLQRAQRGMALDPINDGLFVLFTVPQLVNFVRSMQLKFGGNQELEADACSIAWLKAIGVDPSKAYKDYIATLGASSTEPESYSASHPSSREREARFNAKLAGGSTTVSSAGTGKPGAKAKDATPPAKPKKP